MNARWFPVAALDRLNKIEIEDVWTMVYIPLNITFLQVCKSCIIGGLLSLFILSNSFLIVTIKLNIELVQILCLPRYLTWSIYGNHLGLTSRQLLSIGSSDFHEREFYEWNLTFAPHNLTIIGILVTMSLELYADIQQTSMLHMLHI